MEVCAGSVKSVRVYSTGFASKEDKAEAFYNLARQYYSKGDFENAFTYIEKSRKIFQQLGDMKSVAKAIEFRDKINRTSSRGGSVVGASDAPSFSEPPKTFYDQVYERLSALDGKGLSQSQLFESVRSQRNNIILVLVVVVIVSAVSSIVMVSRKKRRKARRKKMSKLAASPKSEPAIDEQVGGESVIFNKLPDDVIEKPAVKRLFENPRFLKTSKRGTGRKINT